MYTHGMQNKISKQKRLHNSEEEMLYTAKDPRLLLELPADVLGAIVKHTSPDIKYTGTVDFFDAIKLLIRFSWVCKKFEHLNTPNTIKTTLNLNQDSLDFSLLKYGELDATPFFELLIAMGAKISTYYRNIASCIDNTNGYFIEHFLMMNPDANVDEQDNDGYTLLRYAVSLNKPNIVKVLLEHNADMYLADKHGLTPIKMALLVHRIECVKLFIEHGVDTAGNYSTSEHYTQTIAEWAMLGLRHDEDNADSYQEIYKLITGEKVPKCWYEKSGSELFDDTCVIS
jgi:hypothetical protein